ncbi:hypothetical protein [Rickettsiella endosymbiont of Aleochara curtula]|uniref:hypothetical protein n=1 Tax=Rickettsiella endosymbiont of Aleochara curtula TaxID=3077936 RepID=UPI00313E2468
MKIKSNLFPFDQLGKIDYILGGAIFLFLFLGFYEPDIIYTGLNSLNFLFGDPLDFYENCKKIQGHGIIPLVNYPPSIFLIFALWIFPLKLLGLIINPYNFPVYLVYWLKTLTTLVYIAAGIVFYKITQSYYKNKNWGIQATWLWLSTPIAVCIQFIFTEYDIFYVFFTLVGFLFFLKQRIFLGSFIFGIAVTFKYFPFLVFLPLLLFFEKKPFKLVFYFFIFLVPHLIIKIIYGHSLAYIQGVRCFAVMYRVFDVYLNFRAYDVKLLFFFLIFSFLCCFSYYLNFTENYKRVSAYILLVGSIFPFLCLSWHPNWLLFTTPGILLTTVLNQHNKTAKLLMLDLYGFYFFVAYIVTLNAYKNIFDLAMFHANIFHIKHKYLLRMDNFYPFLDYFDSFKANIYFSIFLGYLVFQLITKYRIISDVSSEGPGYYSYHQVRINYYCGISIFLIPAILAFFINK